ncbi:hypothetical protein Tco_0588186 [Tanacetum coccineum]
MLKGRSKWEIQKEYTDSWMLKNLFDLKSKVRKSIFNVLGDGKGTNIWYDQWSTMGILSEIVSNKDIYDARLASNMSVWDMISDNKWRWPNVWIMNHPILANFSVPILNLQEKDISKWKDANGNLINFSSKAACTSGRKGMLGSDFHLVISLLLVWPREELIDIMDQNEALIIMLGIANEGYYDSHDDVILLILLDHCEGWLNDLGNIKLLSEYHNDGSLTMHTMDFLNAFNLKDRSSLLQEIIDSCKIILHAWYLDDGTVIGDSEEVARVLDIIKAVFGYESSWGAVSRDTNFISGIPMRRAVNIVDLMSLLPQLHDPQSELFLLRSCMVIPKHFFGLKTCQPVHMEEAALFFDKGLRGSIKNIVVYEGPFFGDLQWWLASLPIRLGDHILRDSGICGMDDDYVSALACLRGTIPSFDFSCFTNKDTAPFKAQQNTSECLFSEMIKDMEAHFDMTACLDFFREHADHCKDLPSFKYRHDMVRDVLFDICRETCVCVDLTGVSPIVRLSGRGFIVVRAALQAASCKVTKHKKVCIENQHMFIPFAFDTFGFLASEAVKLLNRVQRVMNSNVMTPKSANVVFHRISFAIQKC